MPPVPSRSSPKSGYDPHFVLLLDNVVVGNYKNHYFLPRHAVSPVAQPHTQKMKASTTKCFLFSIVSAEIGLHVFLWLSFLAPWEAAVWGLLMQSLYFRLVSNFPKIDFRSPLFLCVCGKASVCRRDFFSFLNLI